MEFLSFDEINNNLIFKVKLKDKLLIQIYKLEYDENMNIRIVLLTYDKSSLYSSVDKCIIVDE